VRAYANVAENVLGKTKSLHLLVLRPTTRELAWEFVLQSTSSKYSLRMQPISGFSFAFHSLFSLHERKAVRLHLDRDLEEIIQTLRPNVGTSISQLRLSHDTYLSLCLCLLPILPLS
jgi:hypothetical protein